MPWGSKVTRVSFVEVGGRVEEEGRVGAKVLRRRVEIREADQGWWRESGKSLRGVSVSGFVCCGEVVVVKN